LGLLQDHGGRGVLGTAQATAGARQPGAHGAHGDAERDRGLGRATLRLLLDYLFDQRDAHRVWLDVVGANRRARRAYEAVGFTHEGEMREAWLTEDGSFDSIHYLSILEHEWPALREAG